ncbi:hypothetical protein D3C71_748030 [compost metagenome]
MSNKNGNTGLDTNVKAMAIYLAWLSGWWRQFGPAVKGINPHMAAASMMVALLLGHSLKKIRELSYTKAFTTNGSFIIC